MKILIMSDSHGMTEKAEEIILTEKPDLLLHLGDYTRDLDILTERHPELEAHSVKGNCDLRGGTPELLMLRADGMELLLTHGHRQGVKDGLQRLYYTALEKGDDTVLFGHTHAPFLQVRDGLTLLNPGAAADGRYAVIEDGRAELRRI
ncbi:MAG: metallophosphoesterase [Oscillospiraceae bacterium]|nr:metallophosphoesterase [Oscillospiraceae bacterium]